MRRERPAAANAAAGVVAAGALLRFERVTALDMAGQRFQLGWQRGPKYVEGQPTSSAWGAVSFSVATLLAAGLVQSLQSSG